MNEGLLTINTGSSSLRSAVYDRASLSTLCAPALSVEVSRIGREESRIRITGADGGLLRDEETSIPDHEAALREWFAGLRDLGMDARIKAAGHRIVHGGAAYREHQLVTDGLIRSLEELVTLDPEHLPQAIAAVRFVARALPGVPQVACFDTAFHRDLPLIARLFALPRRFAEAGVIRFGFHGLSYEYVMKARCKSSTLRPRAAESSSPTWETARAWPPSATATASTQRWASHRRGAS
ncbi:MAG TPA: hypothetical protein VJB57_11260 [Dehalococcoidia bacterium]|nr:hypothetical protein [Dehalococcoidia bacterium]